MVWKHLKKPAILVASLALAVGIAPMVAFAAEEGADANQDNAELVAQANNEIDSVSITITPPTAGETTATDPVVAVPDGSNYSLKQSFWSYDLGGSKYGTSDEHPNITFEEGQSYYAYASLVPKTGYEFVTGPNGTTIQVSGGTLVEGMAEMTDYLFTISSVKAAATTPDTPTTPDEPADEPAADEPESTEPAATEPTPAVTDAETTTTDTAANTDTAATTTSSNTTASTLPKTADALPVALFGGIALMSALALAMAWRLRKN